MRPGYLVVFALAGCAGAPTAPQSASPALSADSLQRLALHQVRDTFSVIGAPATTEATADGTVYTWNATATDTTYVPNPAMASGFISSLPKGMDSTGGGGQNIDHEVKCKLRITGGNDGLIKHLDFNGPHSACDPVSRRLANWVNSAG